MTLQESLVASNWPNLNRAYWDERVPVHAASAFYDVPGFLAGKDTLRAFEPAEVGDVRGKTLLHLMCHLGLDTLSWARRGATVTGLDFSQPAVDFAASLAQQVGVTTARFVLSNIDDAAAALDGQTFDIVYTGTGILQWLPDINHWAQTVAGLVAPGGFLYLADYHPFIDIVDDEVRRPRRGYLDHGPFVEHEHSSYTGRPTPAPTRSSSGRTTSAVWSTPCRRPDCGCSSCTSTASPMCRCCSGWRSRTTAYGGLWASHPRLPLMFSLRAAQDA